MKKIILTFIKEILAFCRLLKIKKRIKKKEKVNL